MSALAVSTAFSAHIFGPKTHFFPNPVLLSTHSSCPHKHTFTDSICCLYGCLPYLWCTYIYQHVLSPDQVPGTSSLPQLCHQNIPKNLLTLFPPHQLLPFLHCNILLSSTHPFLIILSTIVHYLLRLRLPTRSFTPVSGRMWLLKAMKLWISILWPLGNFMPLVLPVCLHPLSQTSSHLFTP